MGGKPTSFQSRFSRLGMFFFHDGSCFPTEGAVIVHVELLHTSWRKLSDSLGLSLFVETR